MKKPKFVIKDNSDMRILKILYKKLKWAEPDIVLYSTDKEAIKLFNKLN